MLHITRVHDLVCSTCVALNSHVLAALKAITIATVRQHHGIYYHYYCSALPAWVCLADPAIGSRFFFFFTFANTMLVSLTVVQYTNHQKVQHRQIHHRRSLEQLLERLCL